MTNNKIVAANYVLLMADTNVVAAVIPITKQKEIADLKQKCEKMIK